MAKRTVYLMKHRPAGTPLWQLVNVWGEYNRCWNHLADIADSFGDSPITLKAGNDPVCVTYKAACGNEWRIEKTEVL